MLSLARRLGVVELIGRHAGPPRAGQPERQVLSVGQTLLLAAIGRALHPTSKRGWANWAGGTTLGKLWNFEPAQLTSQVFWDQMDRLPVRALAAIQAELASRLRDRFGVSTDSLFYDVTNFFTFIDSRNAHCDLPRRGKNKQKRNDLRQFQLGLLVSRDGWVPLLGTLYRGNANDVTTFPAAVAAIRRQCQDIGLDPRCVTLVCDKGNLSRKNWQALDESELGHVVSLVPNHYPDWAYRPTEQFAECQVPDLGPVRVLRGQAEIAGRLRTVVVLDSPTLRDGQMRGLDQQLGSVLLPLHRLEQSLGQAPRRRKREAIERRIEAILRPVATVRKVLRWDLLERAGRPGFWDLSWRIDPQPLSDLRDRLFGRRLLATDLSGWTTADIVWAYWGQAEAELVFRQMKDPHFLALRPQYHWTDQKIQVHSFCCVLGYLLGALVRRAARQMGYTEGLHRLLEMLTAVRAVLRTESTGRPGKPRIRWQLEDADEPALKLYRSLVDPSYDLGPTSQEE